MTNFDYLLKKEEFAAFSRQAVEAERSLAVSSATAAILSRRALELAVRFVYVYDADLRLPYQDNISSLIHEESFLNIIDPTLFPLLKFVIKLGNRAVHTNAIISRDDAVLSLRNLFTFCDWIDYSYGKDYTEHIYDESVLSSSEKRRARAEELKAMYEKLSSQDEKLEKLIAENEKLRSQMAEARQEHEKARSYTVDSISERETRRKYIDLSLADAGWIIGKNCTIEEEVKGMPNPTGLGYVDYVLWGKNNLPLAVVEAKKASVDPIIGSQQAKLYADCLQNTYNQRPLIYTTNGFEIYYTNDFLDYPKRQVSGFLSQDDLQLEVDRRKSRIPLKNIEIKDSITNRPYQKEAVLAVCDAIEKKHRKMLIVQATGSGKTRVSISIVDVLRRHNYVKNILFLADRTALVKQAKKNYTNLLPDLSCCNLLDNKDDPEQSRMVFSTYPTMLNAIDERKNKYGEKLFTPGHFDLIIVDESHRSIYKRYQDIIYYFDAMLLGMTATPKDDVGRSTYAVFDLEPGVPTYAYELDQAVKEGYLVNYKTLEYKTKILEQGIHYSDLSEEEKEKFEASAYFDGEGQDISSSAINEWLFNYDTIDKVLVELMEHGLKVEGGDKLGKTIIFAKNSLHAKIIVERFHVLFPEYGGSFIKQIDYSIKYVDTLIDDFSTKEKNPQIAVSVDMLDTGIDIPEILNLVFFKRVMSYAKFWQMIGRGTRLCPNLLGEGKDKDHFLIFDFCNNFDFFRVNTNGKESGNVQSSLTEKLFSTKVLIARELQEPPHNQDEDYVSYRTLLIENMHLSVKRLNDQSFRVKRYLQYVEKYRDINNWNDLQSINVTELRTNIAPIIREEDSDELAKRFDYLIYSIDLGLLQKKSVDTPIRIVRKSAEALSKKYNIPKVRDQKYIIEAVQKDDFWEDVDIMELDSVREALRELIQYIDREQRTIVYTDIEDEIIDRKEGDPLYAASDLQNYRKKVEFYLKEHKDVIAVYKLRNNKRLTKQEMKSLEKILWEELGTRKDYEKEYGDTPIGRLVRKIVGVERQAANEAFSEFLTEERLNLKQLRFVNLIVDYIVANGNIEDNSVLMGEPFKSVGSITALFKNDLATAKKIMSVIDSIKQNSDDVA